MAYKDANGRITIDEVAAQKDVRNILAAVEKLNESKNAIYQLILNASDMKGETVSAIAEKGTEIKADIEAMIKNLETTADFIIKTVNYYKKLDSEIKNAINSSGLGTNSTGGGVR